LPKILPALIAATTVSLIFSSSVSAAFRDRKIVAPISSISVTPTLGGYVFSGSDSLLPAPIYGIKVSYDMIGTGIVDTLGLEGTINYINT
jgi:hypothetical protein